MDGEYSPIQHTLVLRRIEPARNVARFHALMIERYLFGRIVLVRRWGGSAAAGASASAWTNTPAGVPGSISLSGTELKYKP